MRQDDYRHYRAVEYRLYHHTQDQARIAVLLVERREIVDQILPSVGVAQYGEHVGRASDTLTGPEQQGERGLRDQGRLWQINRELDALEARAHIMSYALAVLTARERDIVRARYFDGQTMEGAADAAGYSVIQCHRIRYDAVRKIGAVLYGE